MNSAPTPKAATAPKKAGNSKAEKKKVEVQKEGAEMSFCKSEWTNYRDPGSGLTFWYNKITQQSLWEPPPGFAKLEAKLKKMVDDLDEEEEEAFVVGEDDDLGL